MDLAVATYGVARRFPAEERYGLRAQFTRAVASVSANIAEGHGRSSQREYARFVSIARGSLAEVETFITLAIRLGFISEDEVRSAFNLGSEVARMLTALHRRLAPLSEDSNA